MSHVLNGPKQQDLPQQPLQAEEIQVLLPVLGERYQPTHLLGKMPGRRTILAQDTTTLTPVVIKLLAFGEELSWDDVKLFKREAETLQGIEHPAIPRYVDFFEYQTENQAGFALVQSYIEALSLEQHVVQGRSFQELELRELAKQLLQILTILHRRRPPLIHRDLKPSNILLGDSVHLIDFGSVQTLASREGGTMTVVGTYGYMPPEQFGGKAVPASDLYSLGATLVYLVTGQHPAELPQVNLRLQFEPLVPHLSEGFVAWLRQLIEPSLSKRFDSATAALQALEKAPISVFLLPKAQRSLPPEPVSNSMRADWLEHSLMIGMPRDRFTIYQEREAINNPLLRWVTQGKIGCGWGCLILMTVIPGLFMTAGLLSLWASLASQGGWLTLLAFSPLIGAGLMFLRKLVLNWLHQRQTATVEIDCNHISFFCEGRLLHRFKRQQIWHLKCLRSPYSGTIYLSIGTQTLKITTMSPAERDWLAQLLSEVLELPLEA